MKNQITKALWIGGAINGTFELNGYSSNIEDLRTSNFTDLFIWSGMNTDKLPMEDATKFYLQIGEVNCVYYDIKTNDVYWNEDSSDVAKLLSQIKDIMASGSTIQNLHMMLGGGSYWGTSGIVYNKTFENLKVLVDPSPSTILPKGFNKAYSGTGTESIIYRMFQLLQQKIPAISGIQYDDEHWYFLDMTELFSKMLISPEFDYTLSYIPNGPATGKGRSARFWAKNIQKFHPHLSGIYLQTYGGASISNWRSAFNKDIWSIIRPVYMEKFNGDMTPSDVKVAMEEYPDLTGGGIWLYDDLAKARLGGNNNGATVKDYAAAIV